LEIATTKKALVPPQVRNYLVLFTLSLIWGTSFILIKKGLSVYSPTQVACIRLTLSTLAFLPFFIQRFDRIDWSKWKPLVVVALCGSAIPAFLFAFAQTRVSSSVAGILNSLTPLFTLILGIVIFGSSLIWAKVAGVLLGLAGAALLILLGNGGELRADTGYAFLIVLAALCYGTSVNTVGKYLKEMNSLTISATAFSMTGFIAAAYLFSTDFTHVLLHHKEGWEALGYLLILSIFGTVIATVFFFRLVQWTNPVFSSSVAYLMPIVALLWGLVDGEIISAFHFFGMALILAGVYLSRKG
jgi:drug/metabolite transporter (DMT)-like permease